MSLGFVLPCVALEPDSMRSEIDVGRVGDRRLIRGPRRCGADRGLRERWWVPESFLRIRRENCADDSRELPAHLGLPVPIRLWRG